VSFRGRLSGPCLLRALRLLTLWVFLLCLWFMTCGPRLVLAGCPVARVTERSVGLGDSCLCLGSRVSVGWALRSGFFFSAASGPRGGGWVVVVVLGCGGWGGVCCLGDGFLWGVVLGCGCGGGVVIWGRVWVFLAFWSPRTLACASAGWYPPCIDLAWVATMLGLEPAGCLGACPDHFSVWRFSPRITGVRTPP